MFEATVGIGLGPKKTGKRGSENVKGLAPPGTRCPQKLAAQPRSAGGSEAGRDRTEVASARTFAVFNGMSSKVVLQEAPPPAEAAPSPVRWRIFGLPIGRPQFLAGGLLGLFLVQCFWFAARVPMGRMELAYILQGRSQFAGNLPNASPVHSPLPALLGASLAPSGEVAAVDTGSRPAFRSIASRWLARLLFIFCGVMLGSSLWYVSRRLFGNAGGYTALALYVLSPTMVERASTVQPAIIAAWGAFGLIFTSIAVAHTLYAPREVVLWNWRRILLLGVSMAFALGSQFSLALLFPLAAAFLFYLAPERRGAALVILAAGCAVALAILAVVYSFHLGILAASLARSGMLRFSAGALATPLIYSLLFLFFLRTPGLMVLLLVALVTFAAWRRTRFFGTTAPLLVFLLLLMMATTLPGQGGVTLLIVAIPFMLVFAAGVFADLLESQLAPVALGILVAALAGQAAFAFLNLARL